MILFEPSNIQELIGLQEHHYIEGGSLYAAIDGDIVFLLSCEMTPGVYTAVFKDVEQVEMIFDSNIRSISTFDMMFFVEAHKGTQYHYGFNDLQTGILEQQDALNGIFTGVFDFRSFKIEDSFKIEESFDMFKYVKKTYQNFKPSF